MSDALEPVPPPPPGPPPARRFNGSWNDRHSVEICSLLRAQERDILETGLWMKDVECLTINSLSSKDTVPLGTDLDPNNGYRNMWAATLVQDPHAKQLLGCDLGCRVLDAENVGHSYGREVLGKQRQYALEGVQKAVAHFRSQRLLVVVVSQRPLSCNFGEGVEVVIADKDDVIVAKQAHSRNCPIVSRDNFRHWKKDLRLSSELRTWLQETANLQIRFSWSARGEFVPDFDLPCPVVRPPKEDPWVHGDPWGPVAAPAWQPWCRSR